MQLSLIGLKVLHFLSGQTEECSGADMNRSLGVKTGTLYPLLARFEEEGWIKRHWEKISPVEVCRPARHLIKITKKGQKKAQEQLGAFR